MLDENRVLHPKGGCLFASHIADTGCIHALRVIRGSLPFSRRGGVDNHLNGLIRGKVRSAIFSEAKSGVPEMSHDILRFLGFRG
jgi:hypothetical protein